jgi:hypothetical protein
VVVIIVVVVIAVAAWAALADRPQPATRRRPPERVPGDEPEPSELAFPLVPRTELPGPDLFPYLDEADDPDVDRSDEGELDDLSAPRRIRSTLILGGVVVVLGTSAAGLLGAVALLGYRYLDRALG